MTVNEAMVLQKALRSRLGELNRLLMESTKTEHLYFGGKMDEKVIEPEYDPAVIDARISKLRQLDFEIDSAIKRSNAVTELDLGDVDTAIIFATLDK